jgi:hypothetical protein
MTMIDRIKQNEESFNSAVKSVNKLNDALDEFISNRENIKIVNKYYGSKAWFKDKETLESGEIKVKAGVLSEDGVWDMLDNIDEVIKKMKSILKKYE